MLLSTYDIKKDRRCRFTGEPFPKKEKGLFLTVVGAHPSSFLEERTQTHTHTHQVLYQTLQIFAWKIDAKAAINAFASLARLDTARLVEMAEPGQNSWETWAKVDRWIESMSRNPGGFIGINELWFGLRAFFHPNTGWCSPIHWAGAQVNVSKIDIAGIGFLDSLQFRVCFQENEA